MTVVRNVRVLVVDDEPITAAAHAEYVDRLDGFVVAHVAHNGRDALRRLAETADGAEPIDLVLLDLNLPDAGGVDLCRRIRSSGLQTDVIAITAVRDVQTVRDAVSVGVVLYLIKPFTFATFADKLRNYLEFRQRFTETAEFTTQGEPDRSLATLRTRSSAQARAQLEKGLSEETLDRVLAELGTSAEPRSAAEVGAATGISRVTARRYLEYLDDHELVERSLRYGRPGRPELEYRRRPGGSGAPHA